MYFKSLVRLSSKHLLTLVIPLLAACGQNSNHSLKVISGDPIDRSYSDTIMAISYDDGVAIHTLCSATVVSATQLVTAAHCFHGSQSNADTRYFLRHHNLPIAGIGFTQEDVQLPTAWHETVENQTSDGLRLPFFSQNKIGDIALITLNETLPDHFTALPQLDSQAAVTEWQGAGYGWRLEPNAEGHGKPSSEALAIPLQSYQSLQGGEHEVVMQPISHSQGLCDADSGGPLLAKTDAGWRLAGVLSRTRKAATCAGQQAIYTYLSAYQELL